MDSINVASILLVIVSIGIFVPLLMYSFTKFYFMRNEDIMKHRKKKLVYYMNVLSITSFAIQIPLTIALNTWDVINAHILRFVMHLFQNLVISSIYCLFFCKIWLIYYKKQYHESLASQTWQKQINSRFESWYITYKHKWGNDWYIIKLVTLPLILFVVAESVIEHEFLNLHINSIFILSLLFTVPSVIFCYKIRGFRDIYCIQKEIYFQCIVMCFVVVLYGSEFIMELVHGVYYKIHSENFDRIDRLISLYISCIVLFPMPFLSTAYPLWLHKKVNQQIYLSKDISSTTTTELTCKSMLNLISIYKGFEHFMMHLVTECATESLFFIIELIQIKYEFQLKHNRMLTLPLKNGESITIDFKIEEINENDSPIPLQTSSTVEMIPASSYLFNPDVSIHCQITLPIGIPRSELINLYRNSFQNQLYQLYLKYVKIDAIHEINISYESRTVIAEYFDDYKSTSMDDELIAEKDDCKAFNIMDGAAIEIIKLMYGSYRRFFHTSKGTNVVNSIFTNKTPPTSTSVL